VLQVTGTVNPNNGNVHYADPIDMKVYKGTGTGDGVVDYVYSNRVGVLARSYFTSSSTNDPAANIKVECPCEFCECPQRFE
jgi:hypothetical protein